MSSTILSFFDPGLLLLSLSRLAGSVQAFKQPAVTAEIFVGILLGPTILGRFFPHAHAAIFPDDIVQKTMLETIAWLGYISFAGSRT